MRSLFLVLSAGVALFLGTSCSKRESLVDAGVRTQTLYLGNGAEPRDLDPHVVVAYTDYNVLIALFEGLTVIDEATSKPLPGTAEGWDISDDGLVYTFHLRQSAKWTNGDPVTADDFVFSMERILSPELASEYSYMLFPIKGAEDYTAGKIKDFNEVGVKALDSRTLQLTLGNPTPYLLSLAAHQSWFPVHKATVLKFGKAHARGTPWTKVGNFVGNGPFVLEKWAPDDRIVVKKNPNYWDASHNRLQSVVLYPIGDRSVDERNFRTGQVHITYEVPVNRVPAYRDQKPSPLRVDGLLETNYLRFNVNRPPFDNKLVRQALSRAIDRKAIVASVLQDTRLPAYSFVPPKTAGYTSESQVGVDFNAARQLLEKAGYPGGKGFPKVEIQFSPPVVDPKVIEAIQEMWRRELGIEIGIAQLEYRVYVDNQHALNYQISASRWIGDYNDPSTFTDLMTSKSGNNDTGWKNPDYDRQIERSARELDPLKRFAVLQKAEALLLDDASITPLFFGTRTYLIHPSVKGWVPSLLGIHRYQTIWLE
jgi:oligopeptide transport system substrate-binding protein